MPILPVTKAENIFGYAYLKAPSGCSESGDIFTAGGWAGTAGCNSLVARVIVNMLRADYGPAGRQIGWHSGDSAVAEMGGVQQARRYIHNVPVYYAHGLALIDSLINAYAAYGYATHMPLRCMM